MADVTVTEEETTQEQTTEENQTVTIEQFDTVMAANAELTKSIESLKKLQSGSDSKVTELQNLLKLKDEDSKTDAQKKEDRLRAVESELADSKAKTAYAENKGLATQMLIDADLKVPRSLDRLIGKNEEETIKFINDYIEDREDEHAADKDKEAKRNGRIVVDTTQKSQEKMSYEDMQALSDEQFNAIPTELVNKAMETALKRSKT